jgi:hypothetical protein
VSAPPTDLLERAETLNLAEHLCYLADAGPWWALTLEDCDRFERMAEAIQEHYSQPRPLEPDDRRAVFEDGYRQGYRAAIKTLRDGEKKLRAGKMP